MELSIHDIVISVPYHHHFNAKYKLNGSCIIRSKKGKDTPCIFQADYYDYDFRDMDIWLEHHKHIQTKTWINAYQAVAEKVLEEVHNMPLRHEFDNKDRKLPVPLIKVKKKEYIKGDRMLFHISLDTDDIVNMWVDKVNGNWVYETNVYIDKKYPTNIRSLIFQFLKQERPYCTLFLF